MRLRQVALVAKNLESSLEDLCAVLGIEVGFRDPGVATFGLVNGVMPVGDTFLEVVSPDRAGTSAGRYLERRSGDGGYMVILQSRELSVERQRAETEGVRIVWEADHEGAKAIHLHPRDVGGAILSFDQMPEWSEWVWAGPDWRSHVKTDVTSSIVAAELQSEEPDKLVHHWSRIIGVEPRGLEIRLANGLIRFVECTDGRPPGLGGIDIAAPDPAEVFERAQARGLERGEDHVLVAGTRIRPVPAEAG